MNVTFIDGKQAKETHQYRKIKRKLYKTYAAIWHKETCSEKQPTPNYISIRINGKNLQ